MRSCGNAANLKPVKSSVNSTLNIISFHLYQSFDNSSICSELERLQVTIEAERREMHERLQEMRESFEHDAEELRRMLDSDKAKLCEQLRYERFYGKSHIRSLLFFP